MCDQWCYVWIFHIQWWNFIISKSISSAFSEYFHLTGVLPILEFLPTLDVEIRSSNYCTRMLINRARCISEKWYHNEWARRERTIQTIVYVEVWENAWAQKICGDEWVTHLGKYSIQIAAGITFPTASTRWTVVISAPSPHLVPTLPSHHRPHPCSSPPESGECSPSCYSP